ncbi:MAG: hypothetical protein H9872_04510 [Candidatus Cellulosilyticum pullistercoris]|uniref:Uncharacterized protein n=1 Tax=Candidatus Cellulosilyticum pullistercoris TaxID=2838521 RepID=A0A9E2NN35_9FIRM|nr:hypothetical protein [Candidatus Cellulosilyticum pullistercoris]
MDVISMRVEFNNEDLGELFNKIVLFMGALRENEFINYEGLNVLYTDEYIALEDLFLKICLRDDSTGAKDLHREIVRKRYQKVGIIYK